ncbi:hypothetical protein DFQ10_110147 [Winogradskyella eximia]|uniref:Uncharacterized protein n=1 Tax=Winogradskyella eximia TaxID=262006 RepID=A0A3D9GQ93_9FLAO|nr:hypothetical protein [Winogradskyella eximia]RED38640.1 hypothetical protein DFQ10_110147 [Winogradskyella eximia]
MKKLLIIFSLSLFTLITYAQVGIGTTTPDASSALDITSSDSGLLIPRVSLVNVTNGTSPIGTPATSLLVWNTNATVLGGNGEGYYFWNGSNWIPISRAGNTLNQAYNQGGLGAGRTINANAGDFQVNSGRVEFTNTADANGTPGSGVLEIGNSLRLDGNEVITNDDTLMYLQNGNNGDLSVDTNTLYVDASTNRIGVNTTIPSATLDVRGSAIFNENSGDFDFRVESNGDVNMLFVNGGTNRIGIGDNAPVAKLEINTAVNETALRVTKSTGATDAAYIYNNGSRYGLYINNNNSLANAAGLAVIGRSNNQYAHGITAVSGGYYANVGMVTGGGETIDTGVTGINAGAEVVGVHGRANNTNVTTTDKMGGFFNVSSSTGSVVPAAAAVGAVIDNTVYKIVGRGIVSTLVRDTAGEERIMVAPEAPEALFQDYGMGQLINGKATILLDPILSKNIAVDENHPMKVFVQLEGDCNGVYVTNKTANGFEVVELNHGVSNTKFSYQIIANRADEEQGGRVSKYSDMRFKPFGRKFVVDQEAIHGPKEKNKEGNPSAVTSQNSSSEIKEDHSLNQQEEIKSEKN